MSGYEMTPYREAFDAAGAVLGWSKSAVTVDHERQWDCSWQETCWASAAGDFLFYESRLSEGMVKEIIRLSGGRP